MKTLHFFSEFYYPAPNSTSFFVTKIIHASAEKWKGNVRIYCATKNHGQELLTNDNIKITRFEDGGLSKNHLISRLMKFVVQTTKFSFAAFTHIKKNDTVFTITNPAFFLIVLALLRKIIQFRFILEVLDIFPEVLIPAGLSKKNSLLYRLTVKLFNWAYNSADSIIVIGRDMQDVVEKKIKDPSKIVFIPNWSDTENIAVSAPKSENPIIKRLGLENEFVFSIAGNMGRTQGLDSILKALSLQKQNNHVSFLFMGGGAKTDAIKQEKEKNNLKNVYVTGWIPEEEQIAMLGACDIAVVSLADGMYGLSVPSKSYFNIAAGKPLLLIADKRSEIGRIIEEFDIGWIVPPNNPEVLAEALDTIHKIDPNELLQRGHNARKVAELFFCEKRILPQYVNIICTNK